MINEKLFEFIKACPTPYHAVKHAARMLESAGYTELSESGGWELEGGRGYYVTRGGSSLIAFRMPEEDYIGFMITASHSDSPCFKIKENPELADGHTVRLSVEKYGGMISSTWFDRPLSIAGRIMVRTADGVHARLVDVEKPCAVIPNVAVHMDRTLSDGASYNASVDMLPLYGTEKCAGSFRGMIADAAGVLEENIIATDLYLYNPQKGTCWNGYISAPRLDDLQCAFGALEAFLASGDSGSVPVYALFDGEEVGSMTMQGAASTFLYDVLVRIVREHGGDETVYRRAVAESFLVSCDNAHAVHPNHPEYADKNHSVYMNGGIVVKYNANKRYTSDAVSSSIFRLICEEAGVKVQSYANRADMPGGSTLGNIANTQVSLNTVDIGLAQLAMHSAYETAGAQDTEALVRALTVFYEKTLCTERDGVYKLL